MKRRKFAIIMASSMSIAGCADSENDRDRNREGANGKSNATRQPNRKTPTSTSTRTSQSEKLIEGQPESLLPTLDQFDAGWIEGGREKSNATSFYNSENETTVVFTVDLLDSISEAKNEYQSRRKETTKSGKATESMDVGDQAYFFKLQQTVEVTFREQNVIGEVLYLPKNVLTPESNAKKFALLLRKNIVQK